MAIVTKVLKESILKGMIEKGDEILSFNDRDFSDILDYIYADGLTEGVLRVKGTEKTIPYQKDDEADTLGLEFDESVEITPRECCNNCIFCFVQQLPGGMRDTLYVKDDDYRLSFISGSYITCTNLREKDLERIISYKLSPLYISVHATDEDVRHFMLGIKRSAPILDILKRLVENGIEVHTQIVVVGGVNDGEVLRKTLDELWEVGAKTVAIVPVGLTGHREGKYDISPLSKAQASDIIRMAEDFYQKHPGFCYCADEMYQIADKDVPGASYYGAYEQIENGVGLIAKFRDELKTEADQYKKKKLHRKVGIYTGVSGEKSMLEAKKILEEKFPGLSINVHVVYNDFFGRSVTVSGLVTATDIIKQYGDVKTDEDFLMIPAVMLKEFENVFLDGMSLSALRKRMGKKILVAKCTGDDFVRVILTGRSSR